nr:tyrosine-type recombinase/integrase [Paracoccus laeviglucosivorans]
MVNLATSDLRTAQRLRDGLERETAEVFDCVREGRGITGQEMTARERGVLHREAIAAVSDQHSDGPEDPVVSPYEAAVLSAESEADKIKDPEERGAFLDALHGYEPLDVHVDDYLKAAKIAPKTGNERRGLIGKLAAWAAAQKPPLMLNRLDRRHAGRYVSEMIDPMHPATQGKHLTALRGYWKYLAARGHVSLPVGEPRGTGWPWNDQMLERKAGRAERGAKETERPFTEEEVKKLLYCPYPSGMDPNHETQIQDILRISLLSGMRVAEIATLWVEEVREVGGAGLVFDIQQGKTDAAARPVPVHPDLMDIVKRRLKDSKGQPKDGKAWLFHELAIERDPGDTFGKRFRRYRTHLGVDDKRDGKRRSLVNFHSARRWFATTADRAGQPEPVIKDVIGHVPDKRNVTRAAYIARSSGEQMRACVEAVRLPEEDVPVGTGTALVRSATS